MDQATATRSPRATRKGFFASIAVVLVSVTLVACGGADPETPKTDQPSADANRPSATDAGVVFTVNRDDIRVQVPSLSPTVGDYAGQKVVPSAGNQFVTAFVSIENTNAEGVALFEDKFFVLTKNGERIPSGSAIQMFVNNGDWIKVAETEEFASGTIAWEISADDRVVGFEFHTSDDSDGAKISLD